MYFIGIDIGSTTSKCVLIDENGEIIKTSLVPAGTGTIGPDKAFEEVRDIIPKDEEFTVTATGYGRKIFKKADNEYSEISCHAKGVFRTFDEVRTIIDIGGQDAKVLRLDDNGKIENFLMNDKCAAGTGRFLDVMANILYMNIDDLGEEALKSENPCTISSTCTVFAESEVISQLSNGVAIPDLIAGICQSVTQRVSSLAKRIGVKPTVCMSGGVAKNKAIRKYLGEALGCEIVYSELSQFMGAYGAALYGYENYLKNNKK